MFTLLLMLFCHLSWLSCQRPQAVVLVDGQHLPAVDYGFRSEGLRVRDRFGNLLLIRLGHLDYATTFFPRVVVPEKIPPRHDRHRIPWDHPSLKSKTTGFRRIEISNADLRVYTGKKARPSTEQALPESQEVAVDKRRERH